jgi:hypothetical protein
MSFFTKCMTDPVSSNDNIQPLLSLTGGYLELYNSDVSKTTGGLEKQLKLEKSKMGRDELNADLRFKFSRLGCIQR